MSRTSAEIHDTAATRLREAGQRYTDTRRRLVDILARAGSPLSIPEIKRGRRSLPQSSVYRSLADLIDAGVVRRVVTEDDFGRFELTEDLTGHHHHLLCARCGRASDVTMPPGFEDELRGTLDRVAAGAGFADVEHRLDLVGICSSCAAREDA